MATVYLARDIRHHRKVALKLLNPELGAVLGVERFLAEIRVTANLQHPNLLPLFDSGEANGLLYYVMPFVDGESLRARLEREKQLPIDEAIRIAVAVANALEYAHSHGVIHRDLKPENILLQANEPVVADFGIALAVSKAGGQRITQTGLSLGTPQYMSPEQATGDRVIDARTDIYSLAAVVYEMLTGDPPHTGSTAQAIVARVLTEKPRPMRSSRSSIPRHVEAAVHRGLEKLPADRFTSARQFAEALRGLGAAADAELAEASPDRRERRLRKTFKDPVALGLVALAATGLGVAGATTMRGGSEPRVVRYVVATPDSAKASEVFPWPAAISPDGNTIVYAVGNPPNFVLHALRVNELEARAIAGTEGGYQPIISPDGEWLAFQTVGKLNKVRIDGGSAITLTDAGNANGGDWTTRDEIVVGSTGEFHGLSRVPASGGERVKFAAPDSSRGERDYLWPIALPDGKTVVFAIWKGNLASSELASVPLSGGTVSRLGIQGIRPLAVVDGILTYLRADGTVMATKLDRSGRSVNGPGVPVLEGVTVKSAQNGNSGIFISRGGALITAHGDARTQLSWTTRGSSITALSSELRSFSHPRLSPDGRRIAVQIDETGGPSVWIYDIDSKTLSRLSAIPVAGTPVWSSDGTGVYFLGLGEKERFAIFAQSADGGSAARKIVEMDGLVANIAVSPDERNAVYSVYNNNSWDIMRIAIDARARSEPYLASPRYSELAPSFSPDGRFLAFASTETRAPEVYVRSFPDPSLRVQVSTGTGTQPRWSADGRTIFYRSRDHIIAARLSAGPGMRVVARDTVASALPLATGDNRTANYDVARDGRFLALVSTRADFNLVAVPDWKVELKRRMASRR